MEPLSAYGVTTSINGTVVEPVTWIEFGANRMRLGFFADPEGFVLEVMER